MVLTDLSVSRAQSHAATAGDYVALMKPRVMSLVVFTGLAGLFASGAHVDPVIGFAIVFAIACGAGASGALNMWYDSDIDAKMARTRNRPLPTGRIRRDEALALGISISTLAVLLMLLAAGVLAAGLLAFTIWFYAVVYTMWLKRSTPENIVIGGLAGALPPAIAWAGATGGLTIDPLILVAIIFLWTPPHFWALALYQKNDYAAAGVPMLPVTHGLRETRRRIFAYSLLLTPVAMAPVWTKLGGALYGAVSAIGGIVFVVLAWRVLRSRAGETGGDGHLYSVVKTDKTARDLFAFSIVYLTALFAALLLEHAAGLYWRLDW
jgi:protoheme IX farnesyltransferase